jgi:Protein of unknown function (DUF2818)
MINIILFVLALTLANAPWISPRLFLVFRIEKQPEGAHLSLLEVVVYYFLWLGIARYAEWVTLGQLVHEKWEFYAITFCLFLVLAFPGFIYRFFWKA